jgi:integrase
MSQSTRSASKNKPAKPYPDFPLFPHATRRWAKKIRGKLHYFGPWTDPDTALQKYLDQKDDLHAGRTPRVQGDGLTVRELLNRFLTSKRHLVDTREISHRTFADYFGTCKRIGEAFGLNRLVNDLASDDFERLRTCVAKALGPVALGNEIQRVRTVFKYADDEGLIERPIRYGSTFRKPSKNVLRKARQAKGIRMFEAQEIRDMLAKAGVPLRAMIFLGINCGFGNSDCGNLPLSALDLERGWLNFARPKTGIERRCPLWPETVAALRESLVRRSAPKEEEDASLVFITKYGGSWADKKGVDSTLSKETRKLLNALEISGHRNFYGLRRTFETIGGEARDQVAVDAIMGHARDDMASVYRQRISDERLRAVVDYVRQWLYPNAAVK